MNNINTNNKTTTTTNNNNNNKPKATQEWESNFKSTLNRLSTQYLLLLRSASSDVALEEIAIMEEEGIDYYHGSGGGGGNNGNGNSSSNGGSSGGGSDGNENASGGGTSTATVTAVANISDPRAGGGQMATLTEPPPPLSSAISLSTLQTKLSTQNIITASHTLLDLIRVMRMSALIMDLDSIQEEEDVECWESGIVNDVVLGESDGYERLWMDLRKRELEEEGEGEDRGEGEKGLDQDVQMEDVVEKKVEKDGNGLNMITS